MIVERVDNSKNWDEELAYFNGGLFMTSAWLSAISNNDIKPVYLRFIQDDKPMAIAGGIEVLVGKGPAMQLLFYSGIASSSKDSFLIKKCKYELYRYARENGYQRVVMKSYDNQSYIPAKISEFKELERMEYIFRFNNYKDPMIDGFSRSLRRKVRKAQREGTVLKKSYSVELIEKLFKLINETYNIRQSKGYGAYVYLFLPYFGRNEIERLVSGKHAALYYAERQNEILSISLVFSYQNKAYGILMGTSRNGYKAGAPSFMSYELACMLKEQGYAYLNIGGVQRGIKHKGLKDFKDSLGADIVASSEEVTNFLNPPLSFLNPLLNLKRFLGDLKVLPWRLKKLIIDIIDLILKKRDQLS